MLEENTFFKELLRVRMSPRRGAIKIFRTSESRSLGASAQAKLESSRENRWQGTKYKHKCKVQVQGSIITRHKYR